MELHQFPIHVGIVMDGNGRWAENRGLIRSKGHNEGVQAAKKVVKAASDIGLKAISLYVFSTENWKRTKDEISFLMILIKQYLKNEFKFYKDNNIRVVHSGRLNDLPKDIQKEINTVINQTKDFSGLTVNLLINYGGQDEIIRSFKKAMKLIDNVDELDEDLLESNLDNPELGPVDLMIRTGGDKRLSNFLIWQNSYSEFYFSDKLWPDFDGNDLRKALEDFKLRDRRWGGYNVSE